jgi:hypothetical protein
MWRVYFFFFCGTKVWMRYSRDMYQPHHVQWVLSMSKAGLLDLPTGALSSDLLSAAQAAASAARALRDRAAADASAREAAHSAAASAARAIRNRDKPLADSLRSALQLLAEESRLARAIDGRTAKALISRSLAEAFTSTSAEEIRRAYGNPELKIDTDLPPRNLLRITPAGRAALQGATMSPCPPTAPSDPT